MTERFGDWMQSYSGGVFYPLDPRPEDIKLRDIAHALSNLCRFGGHCVSFYSVAEHSVHVSRVVPKEDALWGLLHDATEAYLVDVPRPIKKYLGGYVEAEARLEAAIKAKFGLVGDMPASVKQADNDVLIAEAEQIMHKPLKLWSTPGKPANVSIKCWAPERACQDFINRYLELI